MRILPCGASGTSLKPQEAGEGWAESACLRGRGAPEGQPLPKEMRGERLGWEVGAGSLKGGTYRKDFMSKPRFRICPTTWSQLPGLERLRPPAARYLEPAEVPCRAWPRP